MEIIELSEEILDMPIQAEEICPHPVKVLRVVDAICTIEVTEVYCEKCGEILQEKQWED